MVGLAQSLFRQVSAQGRGVQLICHPVGGAGAGCSCGPLTPFLPLCVLQVANNVRSNTKETADKAKDSAGKAQDRVTGGYHPAT